MTAIFAIVKRLLASNRISFLLTALVVLCATSSGADGAEQRELHLAAGRADARSSLVFYDFSKLMHLGASKRAYFARLPHRLRHRWPSAFPWSTQPSINGLTRPIPRGL